MSRTKRSRETGLKLLLGLALLGGIVGCYWPARGFEFVNYDDPLYVSQNLLVRQGLTWRGLTWAFTSTVGGNWQPLVWLSHMLDSQFFGANAGAHHLTNLLFHCLNTLLLFVVLKRGTGTTWRSAFVAALFAWHPLHVESVAWISERKDVLSTFLFLLTLWVYMRWVQAASAAPQNGAVSQDNPEPCEPKRQRTGAVQQGGVPYDAAPPRYRAVRYYCLAVALFALGLMSKPMVVTLPFVLLLLDFWPLRRLGQGVGVSVERGQSAPALSGNNIRRYAGPSLPALLWEKLPFFALAVAASVVSLWAQESAGAVRSLTQVPLFLRLESAMVAWATYAIKLFWPGVMVVFYPRPESFLVSEVVGAVLLLGGVSWAVLWHARRVPYLTMGWFWFIATLLPVIGLVQVGEQWRADRYTYIPSIGLFVALVWGMAALLAARPWRRVAAVCAAGLALAACLVATPGQVRYWHDSGTLFRHALEAVPGNYLALNNLGMVLLQQGAVERAKLCFAKALLVRPDYGDAHRNLGSVLAKEGRYAEAQAQYEEVVRLHPRAPAAWDDLGKVYASEQRLGEAIAMFSEALRLDPKFAPAHRNLGLVYGLNGELEKCAVELAVVVRLAPADAYARSQLGVALAKTGRAEAAVASFKEAVRLAPETPTYLNQLAWVYATHPKRELRNGAEAVLLAERACRLTQRQDVLFLQTLSVAYAEAGRFHDATRTAKEARSLATAREEQALAEALARKLELYRASKPYRDQQLEN